MFIHERVVKVLQKIHTEGLWHILTTTIVEPLGGESAFG